MRQLLTQDYRTGRDELLAWVQSESAQSTEPLVVGLTPVELRGKLALMLDDSALRGCHESRGTRYSERHSAQKGLRPTDTNRV